MASASRCLTSSKGPRRKRFETTALSIHKVSIGWSSISWSCLMLPLVISNGHSLSPHSYSGVLQLLPGHPTDEKVPKVHLQIWRDPELCGGHGQRRRDLLYALLRLQIVERLHWWRVPQQQWRLYESKHQFEGLLEDAVQGSVRQRFRCVLLLLHRRYVFRF